jgi:hypothetical protein
MGRPVASKSCPDRTQTAPRMHKVGKARQDSQSLPAPAKIRIQLPEGQREALMLQVPQAAVASLVLSPWVLCISGQRKVLQTTETKHC